MRDDILLFDILFEPYVLGWNAKQFHSLKTMWMLYANPCIRLIICCVISLTHSLVEPFICYPLLFAQPFL